MIGRSPCTRLVDLVRRRQLHALERVAGLGLSVVHPHDVQAVRREGHHAPALAAHEAQPGITGDATKIMSTIHRVQVL